MQSPLNLHWHRYALRAACSMAQASAPPMSMIQCGGTPATTVTITPSSLAPTNAHTHRINSGIGPSSADPSGYTSPEKISSSGCKIQRKDACWATSRLDRDGLGESPLSQAGWPMRSQLASVRLSFGSDNFSRAPRSGWAWHFHILWFAFPTGALAMCSAVAMACLFFKASCVFSPPGSKGTPIDGRSGLVSLDPCPQPGQLRSISTML